MNRLFITGDTHGLIDVDKFSPNEFVADTTKEDFMLILGDAGIIWGDYLYDREVIDYYNKLPFTTLFIMGNHENHKEIEKYPIVEINGAKAHKISDSIYCIIFGEIFVWNDKTFFCLGKADSHDKELRTEGVDWWATERISEIEFFYANENVRKYGDKVDYILSHTAGEFGNSYYGYESTPCDYYIQYFLDTVEYGKHCFGHLHEDKLLNERERVVYNDIIEIKKSCRNSIFLQNNKFVI